jgi:hypothetical protein
MSQWIIYTENRFCAINKEFLIVDLAQRTVLGSHNPYSATVFKTKKLAQESLSLLVTEPEKFVITNDFNELLKEYDDFIANGSVYRSMFVRDPDMDVAFNPHTHTQSDIVSFWQKYRTLLCDGLVSMAHYSLWRNAYFSHMKFFNDYERYIGQDLVPVLSFNRDNQTIQDFEQELKVCSQYTVLDDGCYVFSLMKPGCSIFDYHWYLKVDKRFSNFEVVIYNQRFSRIEKIETKTFSTLESVYSYLSYSLKDDDDDDDVD